MIKTEEIRKFSKSDKKTIAVHLLFSLGIFFFLGTMTLALGLLHKKLVLISLGTGLCFVVCLVFLTVSVLQHGKYVRELRDPYIKIIHELYTQLDISKQIITELNNDFPDLLNKETATNIQKWSKAGFIHYLSLLRLTEALDERLYKAHQLVNSISENSIFNGIELLEKPLTFETRYDEHLLDHEMPDMPRSSWLDSLKFLTAKVNQEKTALKKNNPLYSV